MVNNNQLENFIQTYKFEYPIQFLNQRYKYLLKHYDFEREKTIELLYLYCLSGEAMIIHLGALNDKPEKFFDYIFAKDDKLNNIADQLIVNENLRQNLLREAFSIKTKARLDSYSYRLQQIVNDYHFFTSYLNSFKHGMRLSAPNYRVEQQLEVASKLVDDWKPLIKTDSVVTCYSKKRVEGTKNYTISKDTYLFNSGYIFENINFCIKVLERLISYDKSRVSIRQYKPNLQVVKKTEELFTITN